MVAQIPSLRRYARALTGDTWAADDLVQDTLERACNKWRLWLVGNQLAGLAVQCDAQPVCQCYRQL